MSSREVTLPQLPRHAPTTTIDGWPTMASAARHPCFGGLLPERLGCVQCNFCATILLVSGNNNDFDRLRALKIKTCRGERAISQTRRGCV